MVNLDFSKNKDNLIPAIAQDYKTGEILMLAYINEEAFQKSVKSGTAHYWSRSRNKIWMKGETSGHIQKIHEILVDCDGDTVVYKVDQIGGAACHKGYGSCFYRAVENNSLKVIADLIFDPDEVYTK
ncbi:phosphoribosyl-AMP cyclohydrolase [Desulfopila inferna]|uniref:phosphoribosyl-AMP cyclohydrolase n=1 Tax=Desulfopila inferna TaxID=468528 RepID=UPI0019624572|nr:phosphoribosyl-AMP cyclohydrolase [Desulfopila inferna]MBM9602952.1 phosphoribosyl-AMP cyclohydrolase [Desulfopila inferna]